MTRKEQNKILDDKIEFNVTQYKVDRLNAEISAFSSGDLNKYEFLTRKDLKFKPNALDKARFEFSPLGKTFSTRLDKTVPNYQEEGVIKLLKDIRDGLARAPPELGAPPGPGRLDRLDNDNDDNRDDDNDDNDITNITDITDISDDNDDNDDNNDMPYLETEEKAAERIAKTSDNDKVFNVLNKFKNNIEVEMSNLDKIVMDKESKWSTKLNKLNNDVKKLDNYIKENNDKKIKIEKELDVNENERNNLLLKYNQSNEELKSTKYELCETKDKLDKAGNDINEKAKYINELKEIQEKFNYQNNKVKKLESELNEKNRNINTLKNDVKHLENKNNEIIIRSNKINESYDKEIQKLKEELKKKKNILMIMKKIELKHEK